MGPKTRTITEWSLADDDFDTAMGPATSQELENGAGDVQLDDAGQAAEMATGKAFEETHGAKTESSRDRQVKPNKVYIGGLPDHTRPEDLQNCFGKIGNIVTIELKLGYGFVEFESREAAEESVARYHEGYFMGNKIRVEPSHSRGRTFKRSEDPGACFKCGEGGHWARECPRPNTQSRGGPMYEPSSHDRGHAPREYHHHSSRDGHSYRDDFPRHRGSRDDRHYDTPSAPPAAREHRRALTPPPRERREDPAPRREYEDYRMQSPPPPQPASRYERTRHPGSDRDYPASGVPPERDSYDRYDRRPAHSEDKSVPYPAHGGRPRTPPGPPPSWRDDHDKAPRGHHQTQETRRRAATPPPPYPGANANGSRTRRRSLSPTPRFDSRYGGPTHSDGERYSGPPRESTRVRDYHRSNRGEDSGHRRS
ncbi:hypothetical protein OG21DRAFT_1494772 [Imleria badia]|nr:hypothetical protein OG21DRAFT_1494772 [Imleria badia]